MKNEFTKPFAAPPMIFSVSMLIALAFGFVFSGAELPLFIQFTVGPIFAIAGVLLIRGSMQAIEAEQTTYSPFKQSTTLTTKGVYQYSRNPEYLGPGIIQIGIAVLVDNYWVAGAVLIAAVITTVFVIKLEEENLTRVFGDTYLQYCKRVRKWL